jgi:branched-chain amino acid transport system permease protein
MASLYPDVVFSVTVSPHALAVPLIGGAGTAAGPIAGALLYVGIRELLQIIAPGLHLVIVGLLILAVILFLRDGLVPATLRLFRRPDGRRGASKGAAP